jgi:hypothetical protein
MSGWAKARYALMAFGFLCGGAITPLVPENPPFAFVFGERHVVTVGIIGLCSATVWVLVCLRLMQLNPHTDAVWRRPHMGSRFLTFSDPGHFLHAAGLASVAGGVGSWVGSLLLMENPDFQVLGPATLGVGTGIGVLVAVYLAPHIWPRRYGGGA